MLKKSRHIPMQFTVVVVDGAATQPVTTLQADNTEQAWEKAEELYPLDDPALVALEEE